MFGYINVNAKELSEESRDIYQTYYCGLCQQLGRQVGTRGRMVLNYDMTFLIVLLTGLYEPKEESELFTCAIHPIKKKNSRISEITSYAASMNIILAYHNMMDDWKDEKNYTKKQLANMIRDDYESCAKEYPRQAKAAEHCMKELAKLEQQGEQNIDIVAGLTGEMLAEIFDWKQDEWSNDLRTLGFYLGKFVYMMDAYEDVSKDMKKGNYNPFIYLREKNEEDFEILAKLMLTSMMAECAKSFERLPILLHADIIRNILYSGVWCKYEYHQLKKKKREKK